MINFTKLKRSLFLQLRTLENTRLSSNRHVTIVRPGSVYSGSIKCINLWKPLPSAKHSGCRSWAVILVMSCVIFSDWVASHCLSVGVADEAALVC